MSGPSTSEMGIQVFDFSPGNYCDQVRKRRQFSERGRAEA